MYSTTFQEMLRLFRTSELIYKTPYLTLAHDPACESFPESFRHHMTDFADSLSELSLPATVIWLA